MSESQLIFLGNDSGFGEKNNSAYTICENKFYLIDCGYTVFNMIKGNFDFNSFSEINVIITHLHNDHAGSLSQFIMYLWYVCGIKTKVYSKCKRIKDYLDCTGTPEESYEIHGDEKWLEFIKTEHVKELDAYGFYMKLNGKEILYTGDTKTIEPYMSYIDKKIDELYVDTSVNGGVHLALSDVMETLISAGKKGTKVFLMHIDDKSKIKTILGENQYINFT